MTISGSYLTLTPEIEHFRRQFEQLANDAEAATSPLRDDQFIWQPTPETWSVSQCLDHLNVAARVYLPRLDGGIADAIRRGLYAEGPFSYNWVGRLVCRLLEPPPRFRVTSGKPLQPPPDRSRHEIMPAFRAYQVQYIDRLRQANRLDLARARVPSPLASWIPVSLGLAFALIAAHERRHLWQARQVIARQAFPR